jgi:hypothetical protein
MGAERKANPDQGDGGQKLFFLYFHYHMRFDHAYVSICFLAQASWSLFLWHSFASASTSHLVSHSSVISEPNIAFVNVNVNMDVNLIYLTP